MQKYTNLRSNNYKRKIKSNLGQYDVLKQGQTIKLGDKKAIQASTVLQASSDLHHGGGQGQVEEAPDGVGDDRPGHGREGQEAREASEEEDEAGPTGDVEEAGRPGDAAGELEGDGEAHEDDAEIEGDLMEGGEKAEEEGGEEATGDAGDDDLGGTDESGDEDPAGAADDESSEVEHVDEVCLGGAEPEGSTEGVGVGVGLEEALEPAGQDVVEVDEEQKGTPAQQLPEAGGLLWV